MSIVIPSTLSARSAQVAALQNELRRLQVLQACEPVQTGRFDANTAAAVRRFQWFAGHVPGALADDGAFVERPLHPLRNDGAVGSETRGLLDMFRHKGWAATGLLVKLNFGRLRHLHPNAGFAALLGGNPQCGLCERDFAPVLLTMNATAAELGLHAFVNLLFRAERGSGPSTVLAPTSFSAHKIGRGVDVQLGARAELEPGVNPEPALALIAAPAGSAAGIFRQRVRAAMHCRYGGDFDPVDPPHFDRQVMPPGAQSWQMHYYFDQLHYRQALRNPCAMPDAA